LSWASPRSGVQLLLLGDGHHLAGGAHQVLEWMLINAVQLILSGGGIKTMKCSYEINNDGKITLIDVNGTVTKEVLQKILGELWQRKDDKPSGILWDFRSCVLGFGPEELKELSHFVIENRERRTYRKVAFVIEKDLHFGLLRIYKTYVGELPFEVKAFREVELAKEWLDTL
jgi:hypothetical protein